MNSKTICFSTLLLCFILLIVPVSAITPDTFQPYNSLDEANSNWDYARYYVDQSVSQGYLQLKAPGGSTLQRDYYRWSRNALSEEEFYFTTRASVSGKTYDDRMTSLTIGLTPHNPPFNQSSPPNAAGAFYVSITEFSCVWHGPGGYTYSEPGFTPQAVPHTYSIHYNPPTGVLVTQVDNREPTTHNLDVPADNLRLFYGLSQAHGNTGLSQIYFHYLDYLPRNPAPLELRTHPQVYYYDNGQKFVYPHLVKLVDSGGTIVFQGWINNADRWIALEDYGTYSITFSTPGYQEVTRSYDIQDLDTKPGLLATATEGDLLEVTLSIQDTETAAGLEDVHTTIKNLYTGTTVKSGYFSDGDTISLYPGYYYAILGKDGYMQTFAPEDTRILAGEGAGQFRWWMTPTGSGNSVLSVVVRDRVTDGTIPGSLVEILQDGTVVNSKTSTGGEVVFTLPPGDYDVRVTKTGYSDSPKQVSVTLGSTSLSETVYLSPEGGTTPGDQNRYVLYVSARDSATGHKIPGVTLTVTEVTTQESSTKTTESGSASFTVPYGNYEIRGTADGYTQYDVGKIIVDGLDDGIAIFLVPDDTPPPVDDVTLEIRIFSGDSGIPYAEFHLVGTGGQALGWQSSVLSTDSEGFASLLVPGQSNYKLYASSPGYLSATSSFGVFAESPVRTQIELVPEGGIPTTDPTEPTSGPTGEPTYDPTPYPTAEPGTGLLDQSVWGIANLFGVSLELGRILLGMILALGIGMCTAKQLNGGAAEFGLGLLGGTLLGVVIGLIPVWVVVVLMLVVGLYLGQRYMGGGNDVR